MDLYQKVAGSNNLKRKIKSCTFRCFEISWSAEINIACLQQEAEDNLAQAFCLVGDLISGRDHCKASIEILEKIYGRSHIVIGYELVKLSSIQPSLDDYNPVDAISLLASIFLRDFGSRAEMIFPHLPFLRREALKLGQ